MWIYMFEVQFFEPVKSLVFTFMLLITQQETLHQPQMKIVNMKR